MTRRIYAIIIFGAIAFLFAMILLVTIVFWDSFQEISLNEDREKLCEDNNMVFVTESCGYNCMQYFCIDEFSRNTFKILDDNKEVYLSKQ